jgi:hypothetical protein
MRRLAFVEEMNVVREVVLVRPGDLRSRAYRNHLRVELTSDRGPRRARRPRRARDEARRGAA